MEYLHHIFLNHPECSVQISSFTPPSGEKSEHHMIFQLSKQKNNNPGSIEYDCIAILNSCIQEWLSRDPYRDSERIFVRYFLKDASVQRSRIHSRELFPVTCAVSFIEQPPANKTEMAVWVYLRERERSGKVHSLLDYRKILSGWQCNPTDTQIANGLPAMAAHQGMQHEGPLHENLVLH